MDYLLLAGKILFTLVFVVSGVMNIVKEKNILPMIEASGLPAPRLTNYIGSLFLISGSLGVLFDLQYLPYLLVVFLGLANVFFHNFWNKPDWEFELIKFLTNLSLIGSIIMFMATAELSWMF